MLIAIYARFYVIILNKQINKEKKLKTNLIHNLMTIEITMKKEERNLLTTKLKKLLIHEKLQKLNLNDDIMVDYDATSLNLSAMWDEKWVLAKIKTGFAFKPNMKDVYVKAFNDQTFNPDNDESVLIK